MRARCSAAAKSFICRVANPLSRLNSKRIRPVQPPHSNLTRCTPCWVSRSKLLRSETACISSRTIIRQTGLASGTLSPIFSTLNSSPTL